MHVSTQAIVTITWPQREAPNAHVPGSDEPWAITRIMAHSSMVESHFIEICGHRIMASGAHSPYCVRTRVTSLEQVVFTDDAVARQVAAALHDHAAIWPVA